MKIFNKVLIAMSVLTITTNLYSQRMTVKGGLNLSTFGYTYFEGEEESLKMNPGINLGVTAEFKIAKPLAIETGLIFSTKGIKMVQEYSGMGGTYKMTGKFNLYYIDVPLNLKGSFNIGKVKVYGTAGPYLGVGLFGSSKYKLTYNGETESDRDIFHFKNSGGIKRLDYGLNAGMGVEIKAIQIGVNYGYGLQNLNEVEERSNSEYKLTNKVLSFTVGYKFGKKKTAAAPAITPAK
jgi:hypothetical protein